MTRVKVFPLQDVSSGLTGHMRTLPDNNDYYYDNNNNNKYYYYYDPESKYFHCRMYAPA